MIFMNLGKTTGIFIMLFFVISCDKGVDNKSDDVIDLLENHSVQLAEIESKIDKLYGDIRIIKIDSMDNKTEGLGSYDNYEMKLAIVAQHFSNLESQLEESLMISDSSRNEVIRLEEKLSKAKIEMNYTVDIITELKHKLELVENNLHNVTQVNEEKRLEKQKLNDWQESLDKSNYKWE